MEKRNTESIAREAVIDKDDGVSKEWFIIVICVFAYFTLFCVLIWSSNNEGYITIRGIIIEGNILRGLITQFQVMITVYLVVRVDKYSYLIALFLNFLGISMALLSSLIGKTANSLPWITIYAGSIVIIGLFYNYKKRLNREIEQVNEQKERLLELSFFDKLTGIPNRRHVIERLECLINNNGNNSFAFVLIDLDNFKKINDSMGYSAGDSILKMVIERWQPLIHENDILGRMVGDEFGLIIQRVSGKEEIKAYIKKLTDALIEVFRFKNKEFYITVSCGIAFFPQDGDRPDVILKSADIAMQRAKKHGNKSIQFFSRKMQDGIWRNIQIENGLQSAIKNNELFFVYQPQYDCELNYLRGVELLLRWNSAEMGAVSPAQFISVAEEIGVIVEIGKWVLESALKKFKSLYNDSRLDFILSINISVEQLNDPSFIEMVNRILKNTGFDSRRLEFEITESIFISYPDYVIEVLEHLRNMGIRIALDDFGTGYASLSYLQNIPIDTLKIDRAFIDGISEGRKRKQIVGPIISMAHQLGMMVVAEGVEDILQLQYLKEEKCDYIQGFLLSEPLTEKQLISVIKEKR
ncbi:MAG TPA: bifunctional diguanylate cyclase/phosphodiesterase [Halanaerobiales bacterium]|nr:bifunctional diguanylate cyclase/phosphodiesterase [Halanaerobiales bacterium]